MKMIFVAASLAAMMMVLLIGQESQAASARRTYGPQAVVHSKAACADPGSHIWCAPAPSHINEGAEAAGGW